MKFTIAIEAGTKKTAFGVVVPDLPGCFSAGDTVEEVFDNAREAIKVHCEKLAEEKKDPPAAKAMSEWQADKEYKPRDSRRRCGVSIVITRLTPAAPTS